jgi:transcriptional regulator with XRE-family HTH domain
MGSTAQHIAARIEDMRNKLDLTQEQLGERIGTSQSDIQQCESGDRSIGLDKLETIAEGLESDIKIHFEPDDLNEFDKDDRVALSVMLPVELVKNLNEEAIHQFTSLNEYVKKAIQNKIRKDRKKRIFENITSNEPDEGDNNMAIDDFNPFSQAA